MRQPQQGGRKKSGKIWKRYHKLSSTGLGFFRYVKFAWCVNFGLFYDSLRKNNIKVTQFMIRTLRLPTRPSMTYAGHAVGHTLGTPGFSLEERWFLVSVLVFFYTPLTKFASHCLASFRCTKVMELARNLKITFLLSLLWLYIFFVGIYRKAIELLFHLVKLMFLCKTFQCFLVSF